MLFRKRGFLAFVATILLCTTSLTCLLSERVVAQLSSVIVRAGTPVSITLDNPLSSNTSVTGSTISGIASRDVIVDGTIVIRQGARCAGVISSATKAGSVGAAGAISILFNSVIAADGTQIPIINATTSSAGVSKAGTAIVVTLLCCILGLLMKGGEAEIPAGTQVTGFTQIEIQVKA